MSGRFVGGLLCLSVMGGAAGCVAALDQEKARAERRELPSSFRGDAPPTKAPDAVDSKADERVSAAAQKQWDELLADPHLRSLIEEALSKNQELSVRLQEIIIARNETAARRGEYLPQAGAEAGLGLEKVGTYTSQGVNDEAHRVPVHLPDVHGGLAASWEIDLWGKLRNAARAANHRYLATIEARHFMVTQIVAEVASSYYELIALDAQLDVVARNLKVQQDALDAVLLMKAAGRATQLAVQQFEAEILKNQALRYALEQERVQVENHLNVLLGRYPRPVARDRQLLATWSPEVLETGLPSALLDNRPDVRAAERELMAAKLDVEVAKARFYPSLTIDVRLGFESFNPLYLLTPASLMYDAASGLTMPLLNRSAITADYRSANARQIQAVFEFEQTLLRAFAEVSTQLARIENLTKRYQQQSERVKTLEEAVDVSNLLYQSARADYMEVLLTRREAIEAEMELIETRRQQLQSVVALYQALGGGWRTEEKVQGGLKG